MDNRQNRAEYFLLKDIHCWRYPVKQCWLHEKTLRSRRGAFRSERNGSLIDCALNDMRYPIARCAIDDWPHLYTLLCGGIANGKIIYGRCQPLDKIRIGTLRDHQYRSSHTPLPCAAESCTDNGPDRRLEIGIRHNDMHVFGTTSGLDALS